MGMFIGTNLISNYPLSIAKKLPAIMGAIGGQYLTYLWEEHNNVPFDLYISTFAIVAGIAHAGLTAYLASLEPRHRDPIKLFVHNSVVFITLAVTSSAIILVFR